MYTIVILFHFLTSLVNPKTLSGLVVNVLLVHCHVGVMPVSLNGSDVLNHGEGNHGISI